MTDNGSDLAGELNAYDGAPAGTRLPPFEIAVSPERQKQHHAVSDVDGGPFGAWADVSIFCQANAEATRRAGLPNDGRLHTRHRVLQAGYIRLDEALTIQGEIAPYRDGPRGRVLNCHFTFRRADGTVPLRMETEHLLPYREPPLPDRRRQAAGGDDADGMRPIGALRITPEKVAGFSPEGGNLIHHDEAFARARGYRAPLAQGLMQLAALHGVIARQGLPWEMDLEIRFRRPVFWDSTLEIMASADGRRLCCLNEDGKATATAELRHLTTESMEP
ncbi:MAG: MaoC/PaaZ C-terminal domain-containing protein [Alphaproteobacteria bacterium]|nr:MaoC/PaaZ C-terminal domain-containing protein [Alphaproteobacteria bacterium]MDP6564517.1 MaoC/PaaZ C-terminal domain-containing protein [Alphaproteobacteria bacterium]